MFYPSKTEINEKSPDILNAVAFTDLSKQTISLLFVLLYQHS